MGIRDLLQHLKGGDDDTADLSHIRGASLPTDKEVHECTVAQLRDYIVARGGNVSDKNKPELVSIAKDYLRMQKEVPVQLVDRNPDPNGRLFAKINTSSTRPIIP